VKPARSWLRWRTIVGEAAVVAVATVAVVAVHLRLWRAAWREPWVRGGDADFYLMLARGLEQHGSYLRNPNLGWPFGQSLADLPHGSDNLHLLALRVFAVLTGGPASAVNVFFIATFAAVAFTAHLALRKLGFSRFASGAGAFVYAFAPYHFLRGVGHLLLSGYEMVPIGVLLALMLFEEPLPLLRTDGRRGLDLRRRRTWFTVLAAIVLASTGPYYFVFSMLLIAVAAGCHALNARRWRPVVSGALVMGVGVVAFAVNVSPSLLNLLRHGANPGVAQRSPFETQLYGLKIFQLFIPREGHRIDLFARATTRMLGRQDFYRSEPGQPLGLLGAIFLVVILVFGARRLANRRPDPRAETPDQLLVSRLALFSITCMLFGASGGFSFLMAALGLRDIRAWNRISIVIAWFAVIGMVMAMDRGGTWLQRRWVARRRLAAWVPAALAVLVIVVAYVDQGGKDTPPYDLTHAQYASDSAFFATVHDRLGDGASVFNIPYLAFPEVPPRLLMGAYDEAAGYIFQPTLNWSFGFMRGREPDYPKVLETQPVSEWMPSIAAVGFTGIVVDGAGYTAEERALQESQIAELAGPPTMSADGRYSFFDLRAFVTDVRAQFGDTGIKARAAETLALQSPISP
jgi:hypothetical protein